MNFDIENIIRPNIKELTPYTTARHEFTGDAKVYLDANENAFGTAAILNKEVNWMQNLNRYPDPYQFKLKEKLSGIKGLPIQNIFLGNGSDEAIDILFRIVANPQKDNVIICTPTYGMYKICAQINDIQTKEISLTNKFQPDLEQLELCIDENTKMIFLCSPNNPTGNSIEKNTIEIILNNFNGLVIVDEAYINYSKNQSCIPLLTAYGNLVILQTLSKAWGLAGLRLGMAFASEAIINYMNKVKYPYNINDATQQIVLQALTQIKTVNEWTVETIQERKKLENTLKEEQLCLHVFESDANFLLVKFATAKSLYDFLCSKGIIVRDRSRVQQIEDCLRITIGTTQENTTLINEIRNFYTTIT